MATILEQAQSTSLIGITFYEVAYPNPTYFRLVGSNDGFNWFTIKKYDDIPELQNKRDPSLIQIGDYYYLICTGGLFRTKDLETFETLDYTIDDGSFANVWAPEIFRDKNGKYHIVYAGNALGNTNTSAFRIYMADFDPTTNVTSNKHQLVNGPWQVALTIDPTVTVHNDKYYLWISEWQILKLYQADNYLGPYTEITTNIHDSQPAGVDEEGTAMIEFGNRLILYDDPTDYSVDPSNNIGESFTISDWDNLGTWPARTTVASDFKMNQFSIIVNSSPEYTPYCGWSWTFVDNFNSNMQLFFDKLTTIDQQFLDSGFEEELSNWTFSEITTTELNRWAYLQMLECVNKLNQAMQQVAATLNDNNCVDMDGYAATVEWTNWTANLSLSSLEVNQFWQCIENNFNNINKVAEASI